MRKEEKPRLRSIFSEIIIIIVLTAKKRHAEKRRGNKIWWKEKRQRQREELKTFLPLFHLFLSRKKLNNWRSLISLMLLVLDAPH
jgi:hypothetical protein